MGSVMIFKFLKNGGGFSVVVLYLISTMLYDCVYFKECRARRSLNIYLEDSFSYYLSIFILFIGVLISFIMVVNYIVKSMED